MMISNDNLRELLHTYGLKVTITRLKVLKVMASSPTALSHYDITVRLDDQEIDKVTLYRTLNAFTASGLVHKVANEERNWLYALHLHEHDRVSDSDDHAHFICKNCERIYCLPITFEENKPSIGQERGFVITSHEYRLHGVCPDCSQAL